MENYNHTVSGIYPNFEEAKETLTLLHTQGLASTQLNIIQSNNAAVDRKSTRLNSSHT